MSVIYIATAEHPDQRKLIVTEQPYKRQRISTLKRRHAGGGEEIAVFLNGEDITDLDLRKLRVRPGDRIVFAPRVGIIDLLWALGSILFWDVAVPAAIAYGVSYVGGELFGSDLPDSDKAPGGQSFGFDPRSAQVEGGAVPQAFGRNMHHGTIVARWTEVDATGDSNEVLYMIVCFGEGPTEGIISGQIFLNDRPITDFSGVTTEERKGTWNQTAMTNFPKTKLEIRIMEQITNSGGAYTVTLPRKGFDDIEYTLGFDHGVWYVSKSGHYKSNGHGVKVEIAEHGTEVWSTLLDTTIAGFQRTPLYKAYSAEAQGFSVDRTKRYKLKFTKTNADGAVRRADHVAVRSVRGVVDIAFKRPGKALLGIKAIATSGLSGNIDVKVERKDRIVNTYNGSTWTLQHSRNRAWVVYSMLTQPCVTGDGGGTAYAIDHYEGFSPSQLDTAFFYDWSQKCDDQVDDGNGGTEDLMPMHHIFDNAGELWQQAHQACSVGRAHLVWQGNLLTGWVDKAWSGAEDLITAENIVDGSWRDEWTKQKQLAGSMIVNFQDASLGYKRIPWAVHNKNAGKYQNTIRVEAIGCKSVGMADRIGQFALKRNELIRTVNRFTMKKDALRYKVGDVHPIQRNEPNWGTSYRVRRYVNSRTIEVDRTVVATAGDTVYVRSHDAEAGDVVVKTYTLDSISGSRLKITGTFTVQPVSDDIVAIGSTSEINKHRITAIEWRPDHDFDITVENYDSNLWSGDSGTPAIPYPGTALPPVRNELDRFVTWQDLRSVLLQQLPPELDIDMPIMANITWNDDTPSAGSVSWSATTAGEELEIRYKGTSYDITAGNTSNAFIYWIIGNSTFSSTSDYATMQAALVSGCRMICLNHNGTAYPAQGFPLLWGGLIQAGTITASLILVNGLDSNGNLVPANIATGALTLLQTALGTPGFIANLETHFAMSDKAANTTVSDSSGNGNHGTLLGGDNTEDVSALGADGLGFHLNGSDDAINCNDPYTSIFQASFSISMWVKPDDGNPASNQCIAGIYDSGGGSADRVQLYILTGGELYSSYQANGNAGNVAETDQAVFTDGAQSQFRHVCFVFDSTVGGVGGKKIYVDGVVQTLDATKNGSTSGVTFSQYGSSYNFYVGGRNNESSLDAPFDGVIDEFALFDKALSAAEVLELYNDGPNTKTAANWIMPTTNSRIHGGNFVAGSVTAREIAVANLAAINANLGTVTAGDVSACTLNVQEADIVNLNVTTVKIADDATKITNSAQGTNTSTASASWTDVGTCSIVSDGGTVEILAQAQVSNVDVGADQRVRVYNSTNSTTVFEQEYSPNAPTLFMSQACVEIPGSGTRTYKVQMKSDGSNSFTLSSIVLSLTESKGK